MQSNHHMVTNRCMSLLGQKTGWSRRRPRREQPAEWRGRMSPEWRRAHSYAGRSATPTWGIFLKWDKVMSSHVQSFYMYGEFWDIYLSHTQPLTQWCGSSPHCTEPASACPDLWLSHSLWSSRTPHPAGCSPLNTHVNEGFDQDWRFAHYAGISRPSSRILTTRMKGMMRAMEMVALNVHRDKWWVILTAFQLQRANLSVHGVLGQVHIASNRCCNAVVKLQSND